MNPNAVDDAIRQAQGKVKEVDTMYPGAKLATDFIGTFSKSGQKFLTDNWNSLASLVGSGKASARYFDDFIRKANADKFMSSAEINRTVKELMEGTKLNQLLKNTGSTMKNRVNVPVGSAKAKLLGIGTGITADSNDNSVTPVPLNLVDNGDGTFTMPDGRVVRRAQ